MCGVDTAGDIQANQHADLAAGVDIGHVEALGKADKAANLHILADGHDLLRDDAGHGQLRAGILAVQQGVHISGGAVRNNLSQVLDELHKTVALGAEVGLAVDLNDHAHAIFHHGIGHALGGDPASLLGGLGQTLLAQNLNGLVHIALGLGEGLLAVHHTNAGHFAQSLYVFRSDSHIVNLQY